MISFDNFKGGVLLGVFLGSLLIWVVANVYESGAQTMCKQIYSKECKLIWVPIKDGER